MTPSGGVEGAPAKAGWLLRLLRARDAAEARTALLLTAVFFSVITGYLVAKPVRDALFLHRRRFDEQPVFYLITAGATFLAAWLVSIASARVSRRRLLMGSFAVFAAGFAAFRLWLLAGWPGAAECFLVYVSVFSLLAVYLFWALATDLLTPEQASRLFGPVGAGGVLGSLVGASLAGALARPLGTENLIWVVVGFQVLSLVLVGRLANVDPGRAPAADADAPPPPGAAGAWASVLRVMRSPYLRQVAGVVVLVTFTGTLFTYQFSEVVQREIPGKDAKTSFFGYYLLAQNLVAFLLQFLAVAPLQRRKGPLPGLLALVALQLLGAVILGAFALRPAGPPLVLAAALFLPMSALFYSLHQSAKELLYTPLSAADKYGAKAFADTFGFRLGDALGAVLLLGGRFLTAAGPAAFVLLGIPVTLYRGWLSLRVARGYEALVLERAAGDPEGLNRQARDLRASNPRA